MSRLVDRLAAYAARYALNGRAASMSTFCSPVAIGRAGLHVTCALVCMLFALASVPAEAHKPSDSYLSLSVTGKSIAGRWDIALRDIDFAIGLDANGDGEITWGELRQRHRDIAAYALARLALATEGAPCALAPTGHRVDTHTDGSYEVLYFKGDCPAEPHVLHVTYRLFFDLDPQHKGLLKLQTSDTTSTAIFDVAHAGQQFELARSSRIGQFLEYGREGVLHIWGGFDHVLFLISLLLPAVLVRQQGTWAPVVGLRPAFLAVFKVVTAFTLAHSITLSLAALGIVRPPSRWVESAIAASVFVAALGNIFVFVTGRRWVVAFLFGLIHGFGFASVLSDLGLPNHLLLLGLAGFNLGVEAGQMLIVAAFLPLAFALRATWLYRRVTLVGGSLAIAATAALWFAERALNIRF